MLATVGSLISGGLDSAVLVARLLDANERVQPFYIRSGLVWEAAEQQYLARYLKAIAGPLLLPLVTLDLPLGDLYQGHWSLTGDGVPNAASPDEAVYLPGRNALLVIKAALWCQLHRIPRLTLAPLGTSPFGDATPAFFAALQQVLNQGGGPPIALETPFAQCTKRQVMEWAANLPLEHTFSCLAPRKQQHCGACNKCAERQAAFRGVGRPDPTEYAAPPP